MQPIVLFVTAAAIALGSMRASAQRPSKAPCPAGTTEVRPGNCIADFTFKRRAAAVLRVATNVQK